MLCPDDLPMHAAQKSVVTHVYPDGWADQEVDQHRFDACPCGPEMKQHLGHGCSYHWTVTHKRVPETERYRG